MTENRITKRSSRMDKKYSRLTESPERFESGRRDDRKDYPFRSVESRYERRRVWRRSEPSDDADYDTVEASTSSSHGRSRSVGKSMHREYRTHDGRRSKGSHDRRVGYNETMHDGRRYYDRRDPYTGRFVEASDSGGGSGNNDSRNDSRSKGFLDYLKDAFSGYGTEQSNAAREAYMNYAKSGGSQNRTLDEEERRAYRTGYRDGVEDTNVSDWGSRKHRDKYNLGSEDRRQAAPARKPPETRYEVDRGRYSAYNDEPDYVPDDYARRVRAGGYGYGSNCGCRRPSVPDKTSCPREEKPECPYRSNTWNDGFGYGRSRSCSLKAGGNGYRRRTSSRDDDYGESSGMYRERRDARGRQRARSTTPGMDTSVRDVRDRSSLRNDDWRREDVYAPSESAANRTGDSLPVKNLYAPPSSMLNDSDSDNDDEPVMLPNDSDESYGGDVKLPPFMEGRISPSAFASLMPIKEASSEFSFGQADQRDTSLYKYRLQEFGNVPIWSKPSEGIKYERGNMYCSAPGGEAVAWTMTAVQANAITTHNQRDALRDFVIANNLHHSVAMLFLIDAALRVSAIRHAGSAAPVPKANPIPDVLRRVPKDSAPLLMEGPFAPAKGPTAAAFRRSYGAVVYWPNVRADMSGMIIRYCEYVVAAMHRTQVYLAARICKDQTTLTDFDLDVTSECFSTGLVIAAELIQFIYSAVSGSLNPEAKNEEFRKLFDVELYVRLPMGSQSLTRAEAMCLGALESSGDVSEGIAGCLISTHVAVRSGLTEIMSELAECSDCSPNSVEVETSNMIIVSTMILQRLLGYLNILACYLVMASLYHGRNVNIREGAFRLYKYLCATCMPLYKPVTLGEFDESMDLAMRDLGLVYYQGPPPDRKGGTLTPINTSELSVLRLRPAGDVYRPLGSKVPLSTALEDARDVILGADVVNKIRGIVSGGRSRGDFLSGKRY